MPDERYMKRALRLAALGRHASPNPMVGCVIVAPDGGVVGEGYHVRPGQPHAEVNALAQAREAARGATAYVTLEPCSHHGRTPPCAEALIAAGVTSVKIAMTDPDHRVSGRGVQKLRDAGISVATGICAEQARALIAPYVKHRTTGLPWVVLKSAMSLDGKIAAHTGDSRWITGPISRAAVHRQLRDRCDAIITGVGTVLADDPALTTRLAHREGRNPLRVVVDSHCRTPIDSRVVRQGARDGKTIVAASRAADPESKARLVAAGCEVWECPSKPDGRVAVDDVIRRLGTRGDVTGVLVETGGELAASLLAARLVDRWLVYIAPKVIGGTTAPGPVGGAGVAQVEKALAVARWNMRRSGRDLVIDARFG